jgi:gas vesicle protein
MSRDDPFKILLAGAVGFAAGMLLAPRSGNETREQLRAQAEEAKLRVRNAGQELKRQTSEKSDQVRSAASSVAQRAQTVKNVAVNESEQAKEDVKDNMKTDSSTTRNRKA